MAARQVIPIVPLGPQGGGWRRLSTLSEPRLSEMVDNYRALGYEVRIEDLQQSPSGDGCTTCFDAGAALGQVFGTVYVRRVVADAQHGGPVGGQPGRPADELFD